MTNRNASPSLFGWRYQICSAIWVFFDQIEKIDSIRLEGKDEDIEVLYYSDGKGFLQAKSTMEPAKTNGRYTDFKKALESLGEAAQNADSDCDLFYISNYEEMLRSCKNYIMPDEVTKFSELPSSLQEIIEKYVEKSTYSEAINLDKFNLLMLPFSSEPHGDKRVRMKIKEFLEPIEANSAKLSRQVYGYLLSMFLDNGCNPDLNVSISKRQLLSLMIFSKIDNRNDDEICEYLELDYEEIEETRRILEEYIDWKSDQFSFVIKVRTNYRNYKTLNQGKTSINEFSFMEDDLCKELSKEVFNKDFEQLDSNEKNAFYILVYKILLTKRFSENLEKEANL